MAYIAVDLAIIAIFALFIWRSAVRGFIRTLVEVIGGIIIVITAFSISGLIADTVFDNCIRGDIVGSVADTVNDTQLKTADAVDEMWQSMPKIVQGAAKIGGLDKQKLSNDIADLIDNGGRSVEEFVADSIVKPIVTSALSFVISLVIIAVLMFLLRKAARWINSAFNIPILGSVNATLGGLLGAVKGLIVIFALIALISLLMQMFGNKFWFFTVEFVNKTHLFKLIYDLIPFK